MKLAVLWAVAACVVAIELPCKEYCTCLSSGSRDVEYQPGCDCMYEETDFENAFDDSGIYYEPASYVPLPAFIYNHPFYIINPILQLRKKTTKTPPKATNIQQEHRQQVHDPSGFSADIEIDIDNIHTLHNRKEKDIPIDHKNSSSPLYLDLDIHIETENRGRSASANTFTIEDLKQTEKSLVECAELYALLNNRNNNNITHLNSTELSQLSKYDHLSNRELMKVINNKCLHISNIVQKSLNEIKANLPTKVNSSFRIMSRQQKNKQLFRDADTSHIQQNADMITEANSQQPVHFSEDGTTVSQDYDGNKDNTDFIYTESETEENQVRNHDIQSQVVSTTVNSTTNEGLTTLDDHNSQKDAETVLMIDPVTSTEDSPYFTSSYTDNEYQLHTGNINSQHIESITRFEESTTSITNIEEQDSAGNQSFNHQKEHDANRNRYTEEEVPLAKVITHEFSNDTVQSYINGTEDIPNEDFENGNSNDGNEPIITESVTNIRKVPLESDIHGNLYFLVNQHQIPARFVQKPNGTLHIGIDANTICDKFKQDGEFVSKLFSTLCKCYESDNCTNLQD